MKPCAICAKDFEPRQPLQVVCSLACARKVPVRARQKAASDRRETKARLERLKTRSEHLQDTQKAVNAWIRARDAGRGCISCGTHNGKANAGHYLSVGARPELRFEPTNIHLQCERCNTYLHGNLIAYRLALIERIGQAKVGWLEGPHEPAKWTIEELKSMTKEARAKARELGR